MVQSYLLENRRLKIDQVFGWANFVGNSDLSTIRPHIDVCYRYEVAKLHFTYLQTHLPAVSFNDRLYKTQFVSFTDFLVYRPE